MYRAFVMNGAGDEFSNRLGPLFILHTELNSLLKIMIYITKQLRNSDHQDKNDGIMPVVFLDDTGALFWSVTT